MRFFLQALSGRLGRAPDPAGRRCRAAPARAASCPAVRGTAVRRATAVDRPAYDCFRGA